MARSNYSGNLLCMKEDYKQKNGESKVNFSSCTLYTLRSVPDHFSQLTYKNNLDWN